MFIFYNMIRNLIQLGIGLVETKRKNGNAARERKSLLPLVEVWQLLERETLCLRLDREKLPILLVKEQWLLERENLSKKENESC